MDIKVYDEKVRDLQGLLPFLENLIKHMEDRPATAGRLQKFKQIFKLVESTKRGQRLPIAVIMKVEKVMKEVKMRYDMKANLAPCESVPVKKEVNDVSDKASICESVSETPDSPSPTRHYERTSPIEIPTERSDDREQKFKKERDSHRYDDNRRFRHDHQRSERPVNKYGPSRFDSVDRHRSRYDQHERSKSRDRYKNDRRERSNSSERGRYSKNDRNQYRHEDRDSRDNSYKKYDQRTDRVIKTERSDRYSPTSQRDSGKPNKNLENEFHKSAFNRLGARPPSTVAKSTIDYDDRFTEDEIAELMASNKKLFGCDSDDESTNHIRKLTEVRSKLASHMKLDESMKNKDKKPSTTVTSSEIPVPVLNAPAKKTASKFELSALREFTPTPPNHQVKEKKFSFMKTFNQSSKTVENVSEAYVKPRDTISIDDDIINKIVAQPIKGNEVCHNKEIPPVITNMNIIKQALETVKNQQRLALKYKTKTKLRTDQNIPETMTQSHHQTSDASQPNNLQMVCFNDPRLPPRARDPRVQAHHDSLRMQAFSPPSTPPCISNYPPIIQSSSGYKPCSYSKSGLLPTQNHFPSAQQNAYPSTISPQHHLLQSQSNLISITPGVNPYANNRSSHHQLSPNSSSDVSPPRYQYPAPTFPEHNRNSSGIHNKFRPALNDNLERQKYEQSRTRRSSVYYEKETPRETPTTYGEYKRSLQSNVSSTSERSEKVNNESRAANISASHHDKVYRSGNYATPIPSVATKSTGSKFKIPKKTTNETAKSGHTTENCDTKDSDDEQSHLRGVKDSDDSEHEISGNSKVIVNSDSETSDIRDPRMRLQALKKASNPLENKTRDSVEKQNNVVTSSTSIVPENVSTSDNMEFLKHLTNPNNLLALINLVGQMSDDTTFTKVKEVLEKAKETNAAANTSAANDENIENLSTSMAPDKIDVPKTPRKKSKNELEKLNEDIRTMFISDGVLNATGRRVCALYNNNAADAKESTGTKNAKTKKQEKDDVANVKKSATESRITRRRNTMVCYTEPSARSLRPPASKEEPSVTAPETLKSTEASKNASPEPKTTPESKTTKQEQKVANVSTKAAKTKKPPVEPIIDTDEIPTKRVTRAQMKECNIVLEKLSPGASVESLTHADSPKKDGKGKRLSSEPLFKKAKAKKAKKDTVKNINPEFHSLAKLTDCQVCKKPAKLSIVNHYVNLHPNAEVVTSRLAPDVASELRNSKVVKIAKRVQYGASTNFGYSHICYFCNVTKCMSKSFWMNHMAKHTGYYQYQCNDCSKKFAEKNNIHSCKDKNNMSKIPQPQYKGVTLKGYVCDLCNFVRLNQNDIEKHLRCQHEITDTDKFKEVILLNFPKRQKKFQVEMELEEEPEEASDSNDEDMMKSTTKRRKLHADSESKEIDASESPPEKVLRSRVVHNEAFISEPKQDDGLFDKDTMKLMKDMSFSASKDGESTARSNRAKSIAEKLSERFNSVQEDSTCKPVEETTCKPEEETTAKTEPLDPLTCDEGITIIRVTASEDCPTEESSEDVSSRVEISNVPEKTSPSSVAALCREDNATPTEEFADESDDNWESYSSDDSDDDAEVVDDSAVMQRQPNRKNVGIIDTIARLQQSISSHGTSTNVDGVEKLLETQAGEENASVKAETNSETISVVSEQQVDRDASITIENPTEEEKKVALTYDVLVTEAMQLGNEYVEESDVKKCVSNGRTSSNNYSFSLKGADRSATLLSSRNGNVGGSSSNADSTNNDVDMVDVNKPAKTLTRIDNIGYTTRSDDSSVSFCCLIDDCGFETMDLARLLNHIDLHPVEWFGYCFTCDAQIGTEQLPLMMEFKHMTTAHYQKKEYEDIYDKVNIADRPAFIKCKVLPGDKLSTLKEQEIAARAEKLSLNSKPSTSTSATVDTNFLKISNVKTLTSTYTESSSMPTISKVVSLGSASIASDDSKLCSLKEWGRNPTNKLQKNCKKMLRDISLYALYKCMDMHCAFTTDNAENMLIHLRNHENDVSSEPQWLECAYCDIVADSCTLLVKHIQDEHQSSIFQCPYCFYRSCAAFNVVVHLNQFHASEKKSVLVCNGKPRLYTTEKALIERSRGENIRALRCTEGCNKITYVMDHFVKHMKNSPAHDDKFKCQFCGFNTLISETAKHLLVHSVGVYECVYCHYGINDVDSIQKHMCNTHPSKLLYICVRLTRKDRVLSDEQLSSVESTLIFHLGQNVDNKLFQRCPFTDEQLSRMDPAIASNANAIETTVPSNPVPSKANVSASSMGFNIASVTSISSESFANAVETVPTSNTGLMLSDVLSFKDLEKDYMTDDWDKYFATLSATVTVSPKTIPKRKSSVAQVRVELPETKKPSTSSTLRTDLLQNEIDNAAYILVKGTGLEGRDLYRCSFANCEERCNDIFVFNIHLLKHNQSQVGFKCYHCSVVSKNIVGLKYHIKVHGIHRYFCYYCNYTSAIVNDIQKHMQDTHAKTHVNTIPLNPKKHDQNKDMFVMCPHGLLKDEMNRFGIALIDRNKRQVTSTKKFYSPDDMESLPRQAIFNSCISCDICQYSTKVRTNMYRHLAAHKNEQSVPKNDPVNPVPCLDSGEKHFDKMINLACSSNDGKPLATQFDSSVFIPEARRFVCNARNCQYQNISENMLNRHLTTLHPNEEQYKCPHCNVLICQKMDADKIIFHLRMHDSKIYKCPKCMFSHHVKTLVEKHRDESHPGVVDQATLITRDETTSTSSVPDGQPKVSKWKCSLCNDLFATQKLIQAHIQTMHSIKFQYQCDICSEVQSNNKTTVQEHINLKHQSQGSRIKVYYTKVECAENDNAPIWRRDDPNKVRHIRGILFEDENVRKTTTTKKDQTEVKKKTSQKKRSDKPDLDKPNSDNGQALVIDETETAKSVEDSESNAIVIVSDEDTDVDKTNNENTVPQSPISNPIPSTSKNLLESGKSLMGCSKTPIKPSETVVRAEATSSGIKSKKESSLDKAYLCGRCGKFSDNSFALVRAHQATAHPNVISEVLKRNTNNEVQQNKEAQQSKSATKHLPDATVVTSKQKYSDSINYVCHHCIFKSQNPQIIYKHWRENHKFPKITTKNIEFPSRPFMFRTVQTFQCCYCRCCSPYKDLKVHCQRNHPNETFALINNLNPKQCTLCAYEFSNADTDVINHFKECHKTLRTDTSIEPDNYLTNELVDEIVSILPREQVKCIHPNCNIIFFSMAELEGHTTEKHPTGSQPQFVSIPNDPVMYGCMNCPETNSNESSMVAHIRGRHLLQFQCKFCEKRFNQVKLVKSHHEIMHNCKDEVYRNVDPNEYFDKYSAMKIIFPNGFVLTKAEAKHTRYGAMDDIMKLVTELNNKDLEEVRKRQEDSAVTDDQPVVVNKKKKRLRISDSESEETNSKSSAKSAVTLRKKRKLSTVPSKSSDAKSKLETSSASDDSEPLQRLIPAASSLRTSQRRSTVKPETVSSKSSGSKLKVETNSSKPFSSKPSISKPSNSKLKIEKNISSDDSEPLQSLIPLSSYGKKPGRVDLSKVFIEMPFGTSSIKVSCDRFALLFNINPKLRLKRCAN